MHSVMKIVIRVTLPVPILEQEQNTLSKHLSSPPVLSGVRVALSFAFYVFGHCIVLSFDLQLLITPLE